MAGVGFAAPDQAATASQELAEGTWVYFCTFGEDEAVHYDNGMLGTVEVKNEKGKGDLPEADQLDHRDGVQLRLRRASRPARTSSSSRTPARSSTTP